MRDSTPAHLGPRWCSCEAIIPGLFCIFRSVGGGRLFAQTLTMTMKEEIGCQSRSGDGNSKEKDFADGPIDG